MCTVLIAWKSHPIYDLIVCGNRDEFKTRPSRAAHYWEENPKIFAGKDLQAGGTWMGVTTEGRFTVVTNYRDFSLHKEQALSRGRLTSAFLEGQDRPYDFMAALSPSFMAYNPFNLIVADGETLGYASNVSGEFKLLPPGIYGLSNALLNTPWPKVSEGMDGLRTLLERDANEAQLVQGCFDLLDNRQGYADERLPQTGIPLETERKLASIFVDFDQYGTQYQTVILRERDGLTYFVENSWSLEAGWQRHSHRLETIWGTQKARP